MQFFGSVAERAWVHEKRVVMYQGEHQFDELQAETLRKTTNTAERHKVETLPCLTVYPPHTLNTSLKGEGLACFKARTMTFLQT